MSDDRYKSEEQRAKEEAYREYLRLRQESPKISITETPYGSSEMRKRQREAAQRQMYEEERRKAQGGGRRTPAKKKKASGGSRTREDGVRKGKRKAASREGNGRPSRRGGAGKGQSGVQARPIAENSTLETGKRRKAKKKKKIRSKGLRKALIVVLVLVLGLGALGAGGIAVAAGTLGKVGDLDINKKELGISDQARDDLKDYTNIAVLGVDSRNMEDDSDSRSDAIVVVSINKETDDVKMFSVFRDTLLDLDDEHNLDKITHAYSYGGAQAILYALNRNMDLNIEKAVVINWKAVEEIIDTVGGIEIDVQESEIEELNKYVKGTAKKTESEAVEIEKPGKQTLNGAQAVTYARIRKDAVTGDYRRNERMKIVMATTFKKVKQSNLLTMKQVCDNALPYTKTNISTAEMMRMGMNFKKYNMTSSTTGWPYDVEGWMGSAGAGYAWYGPPVTLESNVKKLYKKFFGISDYSPSQTVSEISRQITETTGLE